MIKLIHDYYLAVNGSSYICGKTASSHAERFLRGSERYYTSLARYFEAGDPGPAGPSQNAGAIRRVEPNGPNWGRCCGE